MFNLEDLIINKRVRVIVEDDDFKSFLTLAKENGFLWTGGRLIHPSLDKPLKSTKTVVLTENKFIYQPNGCISNMGLNGTSYYLFKDIKEGIIKEVEPCEDSDLRKSVEENDKAYEDKIKEKERHIKYLRDLNTKQIKYQKFTKKLPKRFFVKFDNIVELSELYKVLNKYGYENFYNLPPLFIDENHKALLIDNREMRFYPTSKSEYSLAIMSFQKFYETNHFIEMLNRIFNPKEENNND